MKRYLLHWISHVRLTSRFKDFAFVKINENNIHSWPSKCGRLKHSKNVGQIEDEMNTQLNIQIGDLVLVHKRERYLYVSHILLKKKKLIISLIMQMQGGNTLMGRVRLHLASLLQEKG